MSSRYISHSCISPSFSGNQVQTAMTAISSALDSTLHSIVERTRDEKQCAVDMGTSVYVGLAGIAVMEQRLLSLYSTSSSIFTSFPLDLAAASDQLLLASLKLVRRKGSKPPTPSRVSFLETDVGVATLVLLRIAQSQGKHPDFSRYWAFCFGIIRDAVDVASDLEGHGVLDDCCEVLYGRAGLLSGLLRIRSAVEAAMSSTPLTHSSSEPSEMEKAVIDALWELSNDETLGRIVAVIISIGRRGGEVYSAHLQEVSGEGTAIPPLMWSWYGKWYLGAAHGVAGILDVLLNCPRSVIEPYIRELVQTLEWLVDCQDPITGNWPSKAPNGVNDSRGIDFTLVQWCRGAAGVLPLLSSALQCDLDVMHFDHRVRQKVIAALHRGARTVYSRGFLKKGIGICHGVAGSVFALLAASQGLDSYHHLDIGTVTLTDANAKYLGQALHLALLAVEHNSLTKAGTMRKPDRPWSLYEGAAGMCCAWAEVMYRLNGGIQKGGIPGFVVSSR